MSDENQAPEPTEPSLDWEEAHLRFEIIKFAIMHRGLDKDPIAFAEEIASFVFQEDSD